MQIGGGPDADDWNSAAAARERGAFFYHSQTRAQPNAHHLSPWMGPEMPPHGGPSWGLPPGYDEPPPQGIPGMGGPPAYYGQPPPQGVLGMGGPPAGYGQPQPQGMLGMGGPRKPPSIQGIEEAWVLVFNAGKEDEDVCVDRTQHGRAPSLLAFECTHDADQFARLLQADGLDLATPFRWDVRRLTAFSDHSGMQVKLVPRGELPPPGNSQGRDPESPHPTDDLYTAHRPRLEELLERPNSCVDDDCAIPMDETVASQDPEANVASSQGLLRKKAMAVIDAVLSECTSTMDLGMLMQSACERVKADTSEGGDR